MTGETVGAVVFRVERDVFFLPASVAVKVLPMPPVARVPGGPADLLGVALVDSEIVPVVAVGDVERLRARAVGPLARGRENRPMLVCAYLGERIGLVGVEILATGRFGTTAADELAYPGGSARIFDVGGVFAHLREGRWAV